MSSLNLDAAVADTVFTAFDFETTGLYPPHDKIVEFGAVKFRGETVLGTFSELVNPGIRIPPEASQISGISDAMVAGKPVIRETLQAFMAFIGDSILLAHNATFDLGFLRAALQEGGAPDVRNPIVDSMAVAIKAYPRRQSYSLQNLVAFLSIPPNTAHRALDDAYNCMKVFNKCVAELSFMGDLALSEILGQ